MNRIDRLHAILTHLQSKKRVTAQEIADRFNISLRTVYRDIKAIDESGVPVIGEAGMGYTIMAGYRLPPVMFTREEAGALLLAGKLAGHMTDESVRHQVESAIFKIMAVLRNDDREHIEKLSEHVAILESPRPSQQENNKYLAIVQKAIVEKLLLHITYQSLRQEQPTERVVEPIGLFYYSNNWHLIAWCRLRNDYRDFRLSRIQKLQTGTESFKERTHISLQEYIQHPANFPSPVFAISLLVSKQAARHIADQKYYYGFLREEEEGDWIRMHFVAGALRGFGIWLLSFTRHVIVENPPELKAIMLQLLEELSLHYANLQEPAQAPSKD